MLGAMTRNWWTLVLRGVLAILFGIIVILTPLIALTSLILLWGAYVLVDGVMAVFVAIRHRSEYPQWWVTLLEGIAGIIAGIIAFLFPPLTAIIMVYYVAAWAIITGVMQIAAAIQLRKEIEGEFWLGLGGLLSVIFGVFLVLSPGEGILTLLLLVGIYSIIFGVSLLMLGLRVRGMSDQTRPTTPRAA